MASRKETSLASRRHDPFALLRTMTSELDRMFDQRFWGSFRWPAAAFTRAHAVNWSPELDVVEKDNRLITRIDLPGMKREDVKVEVTDGHLAISGERKSEAEEKKDDFYRCERHYGS